MTQEVTKERKSTKKAVAVEGAPDKSEKTSTGSKVVKSKGKGGKETGGRKIAVLHDNPPLPGKKFYLASWISPESRQKHDVYAFKIHDMCEELDEAKDLCRYYKSLDPDFDVSVGTVGKWAPWVFDMNEIEAEYADERLTSLVKSHRENNKQANKHWKEQVGKHVEEIRHATTKEGQEALANRKEPAVSVLFKMKQLELTIKRRKAELEAMEEVYYTTYSSAERKEAKKLPLPESEPSQMQYTLLSSRDTTESETAAEIPLSFASSSHN